MPTRPVLTSSEQLFQTPYRAAEACGYLPVIPFFLIVATSVGMTALLITATPSCTYDPVDTQ